MPRPRPALALAAALAALAIMVLSGCRDTPRDDDGRWLAGDFHAHSSLASNDTRYPDGSLRSTPEAIAATARARGLSFVVVTDHSNSAGSDVSTTAEDATLWNQGPEFPLWDDLLGRSDERILLVAGSEISPVSTLDPEQCLACPTVGTGERTPTGHVGCIPGDLQTFERGGAITDRPPGAVPGGSGVRQCQERGGFAIVNHPFSRFAPWTEYDWTDLGYDAIEVWNGSVAFSQFDRDAYDAYLCDRLLGRDVVPVGGSDNHRTPVPYDDQVGFELGPPLGLPLTSVRADRVSWDSIMEALRAGRIVIHEAGTFITFTLQDEEGSALARIGERGTATGGRGRVRLSGTSRVAQQVELHHVRPDGCEDRREPGSDAVPVVHRDVIVRARVCDAEAPCTFEVDTQIDLQPGLYFATVGPFDEATIRGRDIALTAVATLR